MYSRWKVSDVSSTSKTYSYFSGSLVVKGSVSGVTHKIYLIWTAGDGNAGSYVYSSWVKGKSCPFAVKVDGTTQSVSWTENKYAQNPSLTYNVVKATSSTFTVNKSFFTLTVDDRDYNFSLYDIENCPVNVSADETYADDSTACTATFSNYLGTKSTDGSIKVTWTLGSHSYTKTVKNVYNASYVIPSSWLDAISSASSAYATITAVISYGGTTYKTISCSVKVIVPDSYLPTITSVTLADRTDTPVPSSWGSVFIQNQSGIRISAITCAASKGASVSTIKLQLGTQYISKTYSTSSLPQINKITASGALECTVTITDSRGRTCEKTATVNVLPWEIPKFTYIQSSRADSSGEEDNDGVYFLSETAVEYSSCSGLNSVTVTVAYKRTDSFTYGTASTITPGSNVCGGDLDTGFSYDVKYVLKDAFSTVTYIDYVSTSIYLMHFLHGGRGVAFGQKATLENYLDCAFKAIFREDVTIVKSDGTEVSLRELIEKVGL